MAFNINPGKQQFSATAGQTVFTFNFAIFADTDLKAYRTLAGALANDTTDILILSTHYTVSINGTLGGTVTLLSGAALNDTITIARSLPITRTTDYVTNGDLFADTLDLDQDYQTYLVLDQNVQLRRAIIVPESLASVNLNIPAPVASSYLRWNALANALENDTTIPQSVLDSAASAAAALVSANASAASAALSLSYLNDFKGRYYGALASDPILDPLGAAMTAGDLYWDTTIGVFKVYTGSVWVTAPATASQVSNTPAGNIASTDVQSAINELDTEKAIVGNVPIDINAATAKTTPVDADLIGLVDSAASNVLKKLSWLNLKATLKTYFDTLYASYVYAQITANVTGIVGTNFAGATTIVTAPAISPNGTDFYEVEFYAQALINTVAGAKIYFSLSRGGIDAGIIGGGDAPSSLGPNNYCKAIIQLPSGAGIIYSIVAYVSSGSGTVVAGAGGAATSMPTFLKIIKL